MDDIEDAVVIHVNSGHDIRALRAFGLFDNANHFLAIQFCDTESFRIHASSLITFLRDNGATRSPSGIELAQIICAARSLAGAAADLRREQEEDRGRQIADALEKFETAA